MLPCAFNFTPAIKPYCYDHMTLFATANLLQNASTLMLLFRG